ncbi:MAG: hypothetical protein IJ761_01650 [Bacteroidales bacterium]|nr:hypothetical protein [Bacteroidales bacterium]
MKNIFSRLVLASLLISAFNVSVQARECTECKKTNAKNAAMQTKAAACKRAQSTAELNINNVRALINGYGNMWYDGSVAQYHLPKNSNTSPLFCAALWIGGTDVNDQLRLAALRFGSSGDDYWPGPLKINGTASVDLPVCNEYDKHWIITKAEVLAFKSHFAYDSNGVEVLSDPTDDITDAIKNWPAEGNGEDLSSYLAPFYDADKDGRYVPENGDYPYYDFDNELCPATLKAKNPNQNYITITTPETDAGIVEGGNLSDQVLKGDQTIWWVFNDMGNTHTESGGQPIGLEIRAQAFAFATNDEINNMTFYSYEIINRSTYELRETYFSQWVDPDLGYAYDDYVGCDVRRGLGYCYNGDEADGPGAGSYSGIPPAVGIDFFQGPYMDKDGKDNPKINIPWIQTNGSDALKQLLSNYRRADGNGYDTIQISRDADMFFNIDPNSWYFVPGDQFGNCAINGVNFGNNIIDDERFGMRRFVFYDNRGSGVNSEPSKASDYYNYLRGYWKNGQRMKYGGNAISGDNVTDLDCDFMFPGDTDPWHWGTDGQIPDKNPDNWTEQNLGIAPYDRRFMQSAGPFTLKPGAVNYITVGIPFAQASSGNAWSSVELLRQIDDVCQALFENCFKVLDGPQAPSVSYTALSNEIILYLHYDNPESNNYNEKYSEVDPSIVRSYNVDLGNNQSKTVYYTDDERSYKFEGYQIYQMVDANASVSDIGDVSKARLVAQCDIENYYDSITSIDTVWYSAARDSIVRIDTTWNKTPSLAIGTLVNFETNSATGLLTGKVMVNGANKGIQHVFRITTDQFATGTNTNLVNDREYYYLAIAYAHNRYKEYSQTESMFLDGQKVPYLAGRQDERGFQISSITVIPHNPVSLNGGLRPQAEFGMSPMITRLEGYGNGGMVLRLTDESLKEIMGDSNQVAKAPGTYSYDRGRALNPCIIPHPQYKKDFGPVSVKVIDPLKIKQGTYNLLFFNKSRSLGRIRQNYSVGVVDTTSWCVVSADGSHLDSTWDNQSQSWKYRDTIWSDFKISRQNEQLFLDLGLAITIVNPEGAATDIEYRSNNQFEAKFYGGFVNSGALLGSSMTFANQEKQWLQGVADNDSYFLMNWIRSGSQFATDSYSKFRDLTTKYSVNEAYLDQDYFKAYQATSLSAVQTEAMDKDQVFEGVVSGTWAPYALVSTMPFHPGFNYSYYMADDLVIDSLRRALNKPEYNHNRIERSLMLNEFNKSINFSDMSKLPSVRIVFTADTSKWTRCPVIEMCDDYTQAEGQARRFSKRAHASVDKLGRTCEDLGISPDKDDPNNPAYVSTMGMGWFPGYAINVATGERLNMMFGEDSRYVQYNGRDMLWNPVSTMMDGTENYVLGGRHYIYVMNATSQKFYNFSDANGGTYATYRTPSYDAGRWADSMLSSVNRLMNTRLRAQAGYVHVDRGVVRPENSRAMIPVRDTVSFFYSTVAWVNMPLVNSRYSFYYPGRNEELNRNSNSNGIPCDVTIEIDVRSRYGMFLSPAENRISADIPGYSAINSEMPAYQFTLTDKDATLTGLALANNSKDSLDSIRNAILALINVVPNPYYSYSNYETASQLETKVRFVNLPTGEDEAGNPSGCMINIYTLDGTLVRQIGPTPVNSTTYDWDLHNHVGIPIAGGMYLIHVSVPGIGERVIKWFGTMRPVDLNSYQF